MIRVPVTGVGVDAQTRCAHYGDPSDVVAIRFKCCGEWYACHSCHEVLTGHAVQRWASDALDERAVLCGVCGCELTIHAYLGSDDRCPQCAAPFNPGCERHRHLYFDVS